RRRREPHLERRERVLARARAADEEEHRSVRRQMGRDVAQANDVLRLLLGPPDRGHVRRERHHAGEREDLLLHAPEQGLRDEDDRPRDPRVARLAAPPVDGRRDRDQVVASPAATSFGAPTSTRGKRTATPAPIVARTASTWKIGLIPARTSTR